MILFGKYVNTYFIILPVMLLVSCLLGQKRRHAFSLSKIHALLLPLFTLLISALGAKILYILENPGEPLSLAGVSLFGAVFLLPLLFLPIAKLAKIPYRNCMDFIAPLVTLTLAAVRVGCYISGCCGGRLLVLFGKTFTPPVQLMETALDLLVFLMMLLRERKGKAVPGAQYPFFLIAYGIIRFLLEFIRCASPVFLGLTLAQFFSLFSILLGSYMTYYYKELAGTRKRK